ncbi:unnamed protein product [Nyctereutes procyonoides]|uniref:(raccoon dog) hypothetical protein n=1 Tax=Nyctereutes procyonoides TaxID=34880 RepID=A0A811Z4I8_NYCPR|nr:unnamed protein product [Nyctereutes procyonoides]
MMSTGSVSVHAETGKKEEEGGGGGGEDQFPKSHPGILRKRSLKVSMTYRNMIKYSLVNKFKQLTFLST